MAGDSPAALGDHRRDDLTAVPDEVRDEEILHRRVHPTFIRPDGSISSQAFRDEEMSVDRAAFREVEETLAGYRGYGIAALGAAAARNLGQAVLADPLPRNPAHALVRGRKSKSTSRKLARAASWVVELPS